MILAHFFLNFFVVFSQKFSNFYGPLMIKKVGCMCDDPLRQLTAPIEKSFGRKKYIFEKELK
jgi:hypothetical protein